MPGIQAKTSNPDNEFFKAKFDTFLSEADEPETSISSFNNDIWEKTSPNLIIIPLYPPSLINVFEPLPKIFMGILLLMIFKKRDNSFKLSGLNSIFAGPPKLNHENLSSFTLNDIFKQEESDKKKVVLKFLRFRKVLNFLRILRSLRLIFKNI